LSLSDAKSIDRSYAEQISAAPTLAEDMADALG
jgi:hypothetical protein